MSRKVSVLFEIRDQLILKDTLKQMGHAFTEVNADVIEIRRSYHNIRFDSKTGNVSYDDANTSEVNKIKQAYMINFYKDQAFNEGMQIRETVSANGEIELYITN